MEKLRVAVSPAWFGMLKKGSAKAIYKEVTPDWVKVFTTCKPEERDPMALYNNMRDCGVVTVYVPVVGSELDMEVDHYDICSGRQLKLDGERYFVVFFK